MKPIEWKNENLPISTRFDDPYYSAHDGRAETGHVFVQGNNLPRRWQSMKTCTIAELGFGTGLNFLETMRQWQSFKTNEAQLNFISFERFPMLHEEIDKALSVWPELDALKSKFLKIWNPELPEINVDFTPNTSLKIQFGDANYLLPECAFEADAWYLDGFSPAKNPELWNENLMQEVAKHTVAGGTFSTYTAAGFVRRNLQAAGFQLEKVKGFGRKREMLRGTKPGDIDVADRH